METQTESDPVTFGVSTKGRRTVIYRNFEYVKHRNNKNGEIYWRCKLYQSYKCKGHLKTLDDRIVSNKDQEHTHQGNIATSLARLAFRTFTFIRQLGFINLPKPILKILSNMALGLSAVCLYVLVFICRVLKCLCLSVA